jgi:hypothetical protein
MIKFRATGKFKNGKDRVVEISLPQGLKTPKEEVSRTVNQFEIAFKREIMGNFEKFSRCEIYWSLNGIGLNSFEWVLNDPESKETPEEDRKSIERNIPEGLKLALMGKCKKDAPVGMPQCRFEYGIGPVSQVMVDGRRVQH